MIVSRPLGRFREAPETARTDRPATNARLASRRQAPCEFRQRNRRKWRPASHQGRSNQCANRDGRTPLLCFLQRNLQYRIPPRWRGRKALRGNPRRPRQSRRSCLVAGPRRRHPDVFHADAPAVRLLQSSADHVFSMMRRAVTQRDLG